MRGYLRSRACGISTPAAPASTSPAHTRRAWASCSRKAAASDCGNITTLSLAPLPSRTVSACRPKSTSLTRSCKASAMRNPVP